MQYTLRNVPEHLDRELRERARRQGKSLNETLLELLAIATGLQAERPPRRDLSDVAGTWVEDPELDRALSEQRTIDEELWR
jgi:plasmid stability protein